MDHDARLQHPHQLHVRAREWVGKRCRRSQLESKCDGRVVIRTSAFFFWPHNSTDGWLHSPSTGRDRRFENYVRAIRWVQDYEPAIYCRLIEWLLSRVTSRPGTLDTQALLANMNGVATSAFAQVDMQLVNLIVRLCSIDAAASQSRL
jgi:hypothetical protein